MRILFFGAVLSTAAAVCKDFAICETCVQTPGCAFGITNNDQLVCVGKKEAKNMNKYKLTANSIAHCFALEHFSKSKSVTILLPN